MILQALVELAENEKLIADPDYELKPVAWIVRLQGDGALLSIEDNRVNLNDGKTDKRGKPVKPKWVGRDVLIPIQAIRTSGDSAAFLVDKAEYVLGVDPSDKRPDDKLRSRLGLFYDTVDRCAVATDETSARAVLAFGKRLATMKKVERTALLPKDAGPSDLLMFRVGTDAEPLHLRSAIRAYWTQMRSSVLAPASEEIARRCLITGAPVTGQVPLFRLLKNVPGGTTSGVALVSFNAPAWESHGWKSNENAPICRQAAEAAATALNRLLDPMPTSGSGDALPVRRIRLSDDTVVVFWSPEPAAAVQSALDMLPDLMNPDDSVDDVATLLVSPRFGSLRELHNPARFYAMTLTGTQGRVVVRDWLESTVAEVQVNLKRHFQALACVRNTPPARGQQPRKLMTLGELMDSLASPGRDNRVPAALAADFVHAALRGTAYPRSILHRALLRERAEAADDDWSAHIRRDARAALIKAVFVTDVELQTALEDRMDEQRTDAGYLLGRLMAVLEDTQRLASGGVNASIKDKFYGAASATPAAVFPTMMDLFHKHARKARDVRPGAITIREKLVDAILARLDVIPVHLDLKNQGLFVLGYHHQRYALFNKPERDSVADNSAQAEGAQA